MTELATLKLQFLQYLKAEQGRSSVTLREYDRYVERFFAHTKVRVPADITAKQVASFQIHLRTRPGTNRGGKIHPMKPVTQNHHLIALRMFVTYLRQRGIETILAKHIVLAAVTAPPLDLVSSAELTQLRNAVDQKTLVGKRDVALLELLFSTGLQVSELCALSTADIDWRRGLITVRGKAEKTRTVFLSDPARATLTTYIEARRDVDDALFIRCGRKAAVGGDLRINARAIQRLLRAYSMTAGLDRNITPNMIRHTFATALLQNGADSLSVQTLLGHNSLTYTKAYAKLWVPEAPIDN